STSGELPMTDETLPVGDSDPIDHVYYHASIDGYLTPPVVACYGGITAFSLPEVAEELGVDERTVRQWIAEGELRAFNVSRNRTSQRPRLRVFEDDVLAFAQRRQQGVEKTNPTTRRARQRPSPERIV